MAYKLALFDMDGTLLKERTIFRIAEERGLERELKEIMDSKKSSYKKTVEIAKLLKCMEKEEFMEIFRKIPLRENAGYVIKELKRKGIKTAIVTNSYQMAADDLKKRLNMDYAFANNLIIKNGHITGEIILHNKNLKKRFDGCKIHSICKRDVLLTLCKKMGIKVNEAIAVGDGKIDICMLREAGLGVAIGNDEEVIREADIVVENLMEILKYINGGDEHGH